MTRITFSTLFLILTFAFIGCTTNAPSVRQQSISSGSRGAVLLPRGFSADGYDEYIPDLVRVLKAHGFTPVTTGNPKYSTSLYVGGGFGMTSTITLYESGVPIVNAKSSNPGFGTWLAHGAVADSLFQSSLSKFDTALDRL